MGHQVHLALHEREDIMLMRRDGRGVCEIARAIGRSKSTVSRELKRDSCERFRRVSTAQRRYAERRKACRRPRKRLGYRTPYEVHCSEVLHLI